MLGRELTWSEKFISLEKGGKICLPNWKSDEYWFLDIGGNIVNQRGYNPNLDFLFRKCSWYEWLPNKNQILLTPDAVGKKVRLHPEAIALITTYFPRDDKDPEAFSICGEHYGSDGKLLGEDEHSYVVEILE